MIDRRAVLGLSGLMGCVAAGLLLWPHSALGFGPVRLQETRRKTLAALGPASIAERLCGGMLGVLYSVHDQSFETADNDAIAVMAMFGKSSDRVSEISAALSWPNGGVSFKNWGRLVIAQEAEIGRRTHARPRTIAAMEDDIAVETSREFKRGDATVTLRSRWMRRSGATFSRIHLLAAGEASVIA